MSKEGDYLTLARLNRIIAEGRARVDQQKARVIALAGWPEHHDAVVLLRELQHALRLVTRKQRKLIRNLICAGAPGNDGLEDWTPAARWQFDHDPRSPYQSRLILGRWRCSVMAVPQNEGYVWAVTRNRWFGHWQHDGGFAPSLAEAMHNAETALQQAAGLTALSNSRHLKREGRVRAVSLGQRQSEAQKGRGNPAQFTCPKHNSPTV